MQDDCLFLEKAGRATTETRSGGSVVAHLSRVARLVFASSFFEDSLMLAPHITCDISFVFCSLPETDRQRLTSRSIKPSRPTTEKRSRAPLTSQSDDVRRSGKSRRASTDMDDDDVAGATRDNDDETIATATSPTKRLQYDGFVAKEPTGLEDTPASVCTRTSLVAIAFFESDVQ